MSENHTDYNNSIIRGISLMLHELYPDYKIYDYYPEQDFEIPSFIIEEVSTVKNNRIGLRSSKYRKTNGKRKISKIFYHILFNSTDQREIRQVTENVEENLYNIMLEDGYPININNGMMSYINQGYSLISFSVRYSTWTLPPDYPNMQELLLQDRIDSQH